jgi:[acyl-carrier-protein] S-malonyltransferase
MSGNPIAFVFPGQGSQKTGMLAAAHERFQAVRDTFCEASQALGYDMWDLVQNGEQEALNLTETTQPVLLAASVALWRAWLEQGGPRPGIMAGTASVSSRHSSVRARLNLPMR